MRVFTVTLGTLLALVVSLNAAATWSRWRDDASIQSVPAALRAGEAVLDYRNVDERRFQRTRVSVIARPRVVAFGSSRVMQATGAMVGVEPQAFYNLGMSGGTLEDHVALWELLRRQAKIPELAIFSIDPWVFNAEFQEVRWLSLSAEVEAFSARGGGRWVEVAVASWNQAKELVSYQVLRDSARRLRRAVRNRPAAMAGTVIVPEAAVGDRQALRADGSLIYDGTFQRRDLLEIHDEAVRWAATGGAGLARFRSNPEHVRLLEALWRDLRARGVRIVAYTPPYHPAAWRVLESDARQRQALDQVRAILVGLAARTGAGFSDFADPAAVPCGAEEFFDPQHPRPACLQRLLRRLQADSR